MKKNNRYNWIIIDENDINELCYILKNKIEKYAIPYFELNSNLSAADLILNENLDSLIIHNNSFPYRAFHGLIIAHLTGRKNIHKIINKYDRNFKNCDIAFQKDYFIIRDYILNQNDN